MFAIAVIAAGEVRAATCVWKAASAANFNASTSNWSCGAIPGSGDAVYFCNGSCQSTTGTNQNCNITSAVTVASMNLGTSYSATVAASSNTVDISGDFTQSTGTFSAPSTRLSVGGAFNKTGGTFTHNNGTVVLESTATKTFASNGASFYNLSINDGLAGYWKLDEASGTAASDSSGYLNSGTLTNGPTWATSSLPSSMTFRNPSAVTFDGTNDYIDTGGPAIATNAAFTACLWVKFASTSGYQTFVGVDGTNISGFFLQKVSGGQFAMSMRASDSTGATMYQTTGTTVAGTGTWYHVCGVYTGSAVRLYVNGSQEGSDTTVSATWLATGHVIIGAGKFTSRTDYVNGTIDDVRLYSRALSASDVNSLASGTVPNLGTGVQNVTGNPTVSNDLTIGSGTLGGGSATISVGGNFWNYGGRFTPSTGTVAFNGSSTGKYIQLGGQTFNNLTISGTGAWSFAESGINLTLGGTFAQSAGTFTSTSGLLTIGAAFNKTGGTFTHNSGTVILASTSSQTFASGSAAFNNLVVNDGLAGYWKLDENTGTAAADGSGYGNSGTLTNGPTWTTSLPTLSFRNTSGVTFDGTNDYIDVGATVTSSTAAYTACAWVKYNSVSGYQTFLSIDGTSMSGFYLQSIAGVFDLAMRSADNTGSSTYQATGTTTASTGTWYQVCGVYTGSVVRIYVNGVQEGSDTTVSATWSATGDTIIGAAKYNGSRVDYFNGSVDEVRVYSRALPAVEIYSLYVGHQPATASATQAMTGSPSVAGDLTIASGVLDIGTGTISVAGNVWNYGGRVTGTYWGGAGLALTGSSTTNYIRSGAQVFPSINITGSGKWTLADDLDVDPSGNVTLTTGSMDIGSYALRTGGLVGGGGTFTGSSGTVVLNGNSDRTLSVGSFNVLRIEDPSPTNLAGYWKLDEGQGVYTRDWSGNGYTAVLTNSARWSSTVPSTIEFYNPGSLRLVSANSMSVDLGTGITATNAAYTACGWVNFSSLSGFPAIISIAGAQVSGLQVYRDSSGKFATDMRSSDSTAPASTYQVIGTTTVSTGTWYHACTVYDGTKLHLYVNGTEEGTAVTITSTWNASGHGYIGGSYWAGSLTNFVDGTIDDVRIYNTNLSAAQIKALASGRYPNNAGVATHTLGANLTVGGTFSLDSGGLSTSSYTVNLANSDATKVSYIGAGTYTVGSGTTNFKGGLTVRNEGTLALTSSTGVAAIGSSKTLIIDGTLDASTSGNTPTIQSVTGSYTFTVGSSSTATPVLNIDGLAVKNTGVDGMYINTVAGSMTTFTKFDNIAFSNGSTSSGSTFIRIYATSLSLIASGHSFTFATSKPDYAVKLAGNGTADGETRAIFGGALCPSSLCTTSNKSDDDANNDGVGDTAASNAGVVQFVRASPTDTAGSIEGFPTAAFDWNTFVYYSTYVAYRNFSGSQDRIFVRSSSGAASYYWDVPTAAGHVVGTPRWTQLSGTKYVYVGTTAGYVYKLIDNGSSSLTMAGSPWDTAYCYGGAPCSANDTITSPLGIDGTNVYWVGTDSSSNRKFFILTHGKSLTSASLSIPAAVTAAPAQATVSSLDYLFAGMQGYLYKIKISDQSSTSWTQPATTATINGRVTIAGSLAYLPDNRGRVFAVNTSTLATDWSYQDTGNHGGSCTDGGNCTVKNLYVDTSTRVVYGDQDGHIYVVTKNGSSGTVMTGYPLQPASGEAITTAPLVQAGILVAGTSAGSLFIINLRTASSGTPALVRTYMLGSAVSSISYNSATNSSAGAYMVGTSNGNLFFIDKVTDGDAYQ